MIFLSLTIDIWIHLFLFVWLFFVCAAAESAHRLEIYGKDFYTEIPFLNYYSFAIAKKYMKEAAQLKDS